MKHIKKLIGGVAGIVTVLAGAGLATSAHAATPVTASAVTHLTQRPDSGYAGDNWALDNMTRTATVTLTGPDATTAGMYDYTGTISDTGTAYATTGATSPGSQGVAIKGSPTAAITGTATISFEASSDSPDASLVPVSLAGAGSAEQSTTNWAEQFFPSGTTFASVNLPTWSWLYKDTKDCDQWTDAYNLTQANSGDITGVDTCTTSVAALGNQIVTVGQAASVQVSGSTLSSDKSLTYTATGLPDGLTISASTGLISGTPKADATGGPVNLTVTDFGGNFATTSFGITVNPATVTTPAPVTLSGGHVVAGTLKPTRATVAWSQSAPTADTLVISGPGAINGHVGHVPAGTTEGAYEGLEAGHTYTVKITTSGGVTGRVTFKTP